MVSGFFSGGFDAFFTLQGSKRLLHKTQDQFLLDGHIFSHTFDSLIEKYIYEINESGNVAAHARRTMETGCFCAIPSFSGNLLQLLCMGVCVQFFYK